MLNVNAKCERFFTSSQFIVIFKFISLFLSWMSSRMSDFNEVTVFYFVCKSTLYVLSRAVREVGCIIETLKVFCSGFRVYSR